MEAGPALSSPGPALLHIREAWGQCRGPGASAGLSSTAPAVERGGQGKSRCRTAAAPRVGVGGASSRKQGSLLGLHSSNRWLFFWDFKGLRAPTGGSLTPEAGERRGSQEKAAGCVRDGVEGTVAPGRCLVCFLSLVCRLVDVHANRRSCRATRTRSLACPGSGGVSPKHRATRAALCPGEHLREEVLAPCHDLALGSVRFWCLLHSVCRRDSSRRPWSASAVAHGASCLVQRKIPGNLGSGRNPQILVFWEEIFASRQAIL